MTRLQQLCSKMKRAHDLIERYGNFYDDHTVALSHYRPSFRVAATENGLQVYLLYPLKWPWFEPYAPRYFSLVYPMARHRDGRYFLGAIKDDGDGCRYWPVKEVERKRFRELVRENPKLADLMALTARAYLDYAERLKREWEANPLLPRLQGYARMLKLEGVVHTVPEDRPTLDAFINELVESSDVLQAMGYGGYRMHDVSPKMAAGLLKRIGVDLDPAILDK